MVSLSSLPHESKSNLLRAEKRDVYRLRVNQQAVIVYCYVGLINSLSVEPSVDGVHARWEGECRESIYFFFIVFCLRAEG